MSVLDKIPFLDLKVTSSNPKVDKLTQFVLNLMDLNYIDDDLMLTEQGYAALKTYCNKDDNQKAIDLQDAGNKPGDTYVFQG